MTKVPGFRRIKIVDSDKLVGKMNKIMQSWDEVGVSKVGDYVACAFTELAQEMELPVDQVLTSNQVKRLKENGVL